MAGRDIIYMQRAQMWNFEACLAGVSAGLWDDEEPVRGWKLFDLEEIKVVFKNELISYSMRMMNYVDNQSKMPLYIYYRYWR